jgi:hypothetical protein
MNLPASVYVETSRAGSCFDSATEMTSEHTAGVPGALRPCFGLTHPPSFEFEGYRIGVAHTQAELDAAHALVHRMYSWRGYMTSAEERKWAMADRITLKGSTGECAIGTLSVVLDTADGLAADELYRDEINVLRKPGKRLCEFTRLAVDIEPRFNSKDFLARLIHVAFVYAHPIQHATDMLIEVNPRHATFYRRSLGFSQIGPERICSRVEAPAVLMHIDLHHMAAQIRVHGGGNHHGSRTLYPHFLSGNEERALRHRMGYYLHHLESKAMQLLPDIPSGFPVLRPQADEAHRQLAA